MPTLSTLVLFALAALGHWLNQNSYVQRWQRYITGSIYILLGVTTAVSGSEKK